MARGRRWTTFDVYVVKSRNGMWGHRAYGVDRRGNLTEPLPKTLEKRFVCRVSDCRYRIDAVREAISHTFGDRD